MQETAKRKKYLDAAKGLGISLIVFGHLTNINNPVDLYIGTFKIVIFFVISGYLFYETGTLQRYSIRSFIKNRLQSLLLPYFLYSILLALYQSLIDLYNGRSFSQILDRVAGMAYKCLSLRGYSTLWFLPCLFLGQLFFCTGREKAWKTAAGIFASFCSGRMPGYQPSASGPGGCIDSTDL